MAETMRGRCARGLGALVLVALASRAEAGSARLRWMPVNDSQVAGYRVYTRAAGTHYGAPRDAGLPATQSDGTIAYVVSGLTSGQTYYFAVTAYTATLESSFSREIALGTPNPCQIDHCTSATSCEIRPAADGSSCDDGLFCDGIAVCEAGACQSGAPPNCDDGVPCTNDRCDETLARCVHESRANCCASDADCRDDDACTSAERCFGGSCYSASEICPAASCASAFCDPATGCGLMPTPDGLTCEPCGILEPQKIVLRAEGDGGRLSLLGRFASDATVDPTSFGMLLELSDSSGVLYSASVPAEWFTAKKDGTKFRFLAAKDEVSATNGITSVLLRIRGSAWSVKVRAASNAVVGAIGRTPLAATLSFGFLCMSDANLACDLTPSRAICR